MRDDLAGIDLNIAGALALGLGLHARLALRRRGRGAHRDPLAHDGVDPRRRDGAGDVGFCARLVGRREVLRRRAEVHGHALAGVGGFPFDLDGDRTEVLRRLHEGADLRIDLRVRRVLRAQGVGVAAELGARRFAQSAETGTVSPAIREHGREGKHHRNHHPGSVSHGRYDKGFREPCAASTQKIR
jgi:hypothetical protein